MSKRSDRREAERQTRKLAYQQLRQERAQSPAAVITPEAETEPTEDLLARAHAFFHQPETETAAPVICEARGITQPVLAEPIIAEPAIAAAPEISKAQRAANRANAQLSTGPVTSEGKAAVSQNRRSHGLTGRFTVLPWEDAAAFQTLAQSVYAEHNPQSDFEQRLTDSLIQHYWLKERAVQLQDQLLSQAINPTEVDPKKLALFLRYQTTHERSYYKAEKELLNLQKTKRQEENGFESQNRRQEAHEARVRLSHARAQNLEIDTACRQVMEAPIPGNERLSFEELTKACTSGIATAVYQKHRAPKR